MRALIPSRPRRVVSEVINRVVRFNIWRMTPAQVTVDRTITNYEFWDRLRRGMAEGYEFGGLFCLPLAQLIASHVLDEDVNARLVASANGTSPNGHHEYTNTLLARFMAQYRALLSQVLVDTYGLGDQFVVVNADGTLSVPSPETVEVTYSPIDYRKVILITITTRLEDYVVTDAYTAEARTLTVERLRTTEEGEKGIVSLEVYPNLIGRIPVVHFPNDRSANETHGRPLYEPLLHLFSRYDDLMEKAIDGAELMGNPVPVVYGLKDPSAVVTAHEPQEDETFYDDDGHEETRQVINVDTRWGMILGEGGKFDFATPPVGFSRDTRDILKLLFLLMLDFTRVPEAVWGGAIASSKASAEAQMPPFYTYITGRRLQAEGQGEDAMLGTKAAGGFLELLTIWLSYKKLTDPRVVLDPIEMIWPDLGNVDLDVKRKWMEYLHRMGLITDATAVGLSGFVEDPAKEVAQANADPGNTARKDPGSSATQAARRGTGKSDDEDDET